MWTRHGASTIPAVTVLGISAHLDLGVTDSRQGSRSDLVPLLIWRAKAILGGSVLFSYGKKSSGVIPLMLAVIHSLFAIWRFCFSNAVSVCCLVWPLWCWLENSKNPTFDKVSEMEVLPETTFLTYCLWRSSPTADRLWIEATLFRYTYMEILNLSPAILIFATSIAYC